jgi:uncharacterized protein (DUF983 family)
LPDPHPAALPPVQVALRGCCPRCGQGALFTGSRLRGGIALAPGCTACGLDYGRFNIGDGAAPFLIFIVGGLVMVLALVADAHWAWPWWAHGLVWTPLTLVLTLVLMRLAKGLLVALEWRGNPFAGA